MAWFPDATTDAAVVAIIAMTLSGVRWAVLSDGGDVWRGARGSLFLRRGVALVREVGNEL